MTEQEKQATLEQDDIETVDGTTAGQSGAEGGEPTAAAEAANAQPESDAAGQSEPGAAAGDAELVRKLEEQRKLADEQYNRYLRTQADFDNFRKRSRLEKEEFAKYASAQLIEQLLPIVDNFERALAASNETNDAEALRKGVDMIYRQLEQVLVQEGLERIESVGRPFDPNVHQAVMQVESAEHEEGTVVEELQTGYRLKDKVLRPAMVKVSG